MLHNTKTIPNQIRACDTRTQSDQLCYTRPQPYQTRLGHVTPEHSQISYVSPDHNQTRPDQGMFHQTTTIQDHISSCKTRPKSCYTRPRPDQIGLGMFHTRPQPYQTRFGHVAPDQSHTGQDQGIWIQTTAVLCQIRACYTRPQPCQIELKSRPHQILLDHSR